jgi:hypothetical protein
MRKQVIILIALIALTLIISLLKNSLVIVNYSIKFSHFTTTDNNVYFSPTLNKDEKDRLILLVDSAISRNNHFWGKHVSKYQIVFCSSENELKKYSHGLNTVSFSSFIGNFIVFNQKFADINTISHELCHLYLWERIGFRQKRKLPVWFDEGTAMQLDYRDYMYDSTIAKNYKTDPALLNIISSNMGFYKVNWDAQRYNYIIAKCEVQKWISQNGLNNFIRLVDLLGKGSEFSKVYK